MTDLIELERQYAAAKATGDTDAIRALLPALNAARRAAGTGAAALAQAEAAGRKLTPDQRLMLAIFGE